MKTLAQILRESAGQRISKRASNRPYSIENDVLIHNRDSRENRANAMRFDKICPKINEAIVKLMDLETFFVENGFEEGSIMSNVFVSLNDRRIFTLYADNDNWLYLRCDFSGGSSEECERGKFSTMYSFFSNKENSDLISAELNEYDNDDDAYYIFVGRYNTGLAINSIDAPYTEQIFDICISIDDRALNNMLTKTPFCKNAIIDGKKHQYYIQFNLKDIDKVCKILKTYATKY